MKRAKKTAATIPSITKEPDPEQSQLQPHQSEPPQSLVPLTEKLHSIRNEALHNRSHTSKLITSLQAQREQLEEMRTEIDATIAFLRAQRNR